MLKKTVCCLYVAVIACMAAATLVERYRGTDFAHSAIYGSWWFVALWATLAVAGVAYYLCRGPRRASTALIHLSLAVILAGALLTRLTGWRGAIKLREKAEVGTCFVMDSRGQVSERELPFRLRLERFRVSYHEGTDAEADYESLFTVVDGERETEARVSMNHIFEYQGIRFYQMSYDQDHRGSVLALNADPWGIPVTYAGYASLFLSLLWMLLDPKGTFRSLARSGLVRKGMALALLLALSPVARAAKTLPRETAERFGSLYIMYNGRVCPVQTLAIDFTKKLCGKASYRGYTPEQVLTGFLFYGEEWAREPVVKVKGKELREALGLPGQCAVSDFFSHERGGYILGEYVRDYYGGRQDKLCRQAADLDDRLAMVMDVRRGKLLRLFPLTAGGETTWHSPADNLEGSPASAQERAFIANVLALVAHEAERGNTAGADRVLDKLRSYQRRGGGDTLPGEARWRAERAYNAVPLATLLSMFDLAAGLLCFVSLLWGVTRAGGTRPFLSHHPAIGWGLLLVSLLGLTCCLGLRWAISGRVPLGNGYETMLALAWCVTLLALAAYRRFRVALPFGLMMSGFFLLVAHVGQMDPRVTHVMPVLSSPLLSLHVSVIMMSFALLSLTFACGVTALALLRLRGSARAWRQVESLTLLSRLMLYPAIALLGMGVFVGAIWANVSWGTYWSWDAKETWGLITLMAYAAAAHPASLPFLRRPAGYHLYMTLAFLTIIMTYFGVNYFLGGMHSYA